MKTSQIIQCLTEDGLALSVSPDGNLKILGDQEKIDNWIETIRENKSAILSELQSQRILQELGNDSSKKYSVIVTDASTDPVMVKVAIRGLASFELAIPRAFYDGLALLQVVEQYSTDTALKIVGNTNPSTNGRKRGHGVPDKQEKAA